MQQTPLKKKRRWFNRSKDSDAQPKPTTDGASLDRPSTQTNGSASGNIQWPDTRTLPQPERVEQVLHVQGKNESLSVYRTKILPKWLKRSQSTQAESHKESRESHELQEQPSMNRLLALQ